MPALLPRGGTFFNVPNAVFIIRTLRTCGHDRPRWSGHSVGIGTAASCPRGGTFFNVPNAAFIVLGLALSGCGPAAAPPAKPVPVAVARHDHADHGHADHDHEHPTTLAGAVAEIEKAWKQIRDALKSGDRDGADDKVHEVGHLLEDCEVLASKQPAESREAAKQAVEEVFGCFDTLDTALHGDDDAWKKIDLEELGKRLEAAFGKLAALAKDGG